MTTKNFVVKNGLTTGNIILDASSSNITANYVVANLSVPSTANLGAVGNITITGGTSGQVLRTNGSGVLSWVDQTGGGGSSSYASITIDNFTGNGVQTDFTLSVTPSSESDITVNYNGALQLHSAYTLSGNVLTMSEAPTNGSYLEVTSIAGLTAGTGASFTTHNYTGDGANVNFTVSDGTTVSSVLVTENGVLQTPTTDYTISGTTLTFTTAPATGVHIQIRELTVAVASSSSSNPGGSNTYLQFNDAGSFGGNSKLSYDKFTSTLTIPNVSITGNMIPTSNNVQTLGTPTSVWKDVYIGPGSLYVDGQKVLGSVNNTITVSADNNQSVKLTTSGSGDIILDPTGTGVIQVKGPLQIEAGSAVTSSDGNKISYADPIAVDSLTSLTTNTDLILSADGTGNVKIDDDVIITGNLTIQGTTGNLSVTNLVIQDNIVDINAETTGTPSQNAGLRVIRGDQPSTQVRWLESGSSGKWQYTNDGTTYLDVVGADSSGNITANYFIGNGSQLTGLPASYANSNVASYLPTYSGLIGGTLSTAAQPNITSVGTLASLSVTGITTATGGVKTANILDTSGTVTLQTKYNSVSGDVGVVGNLVVGTGGTGNINTGNIIITGNISGNVNGNPIGYKNVPAVGTKTSSYTLTTADIGKYVQIGSGGSVIIPNSTFSEGDIVSLFNNTAGSITITCSTTTTYIAGTDATKSTITLATRGVATIFFISGTLCVVSGSVS